jgi:hypothetical protein
MFPIVMFHIDPVFHSSFSTRNDLLSGDNEFEASARISKKKVLVEQRDLFDMTGYRLFIYRCWVPFLRIPVLPAS